MAGGKVLLLGLGMQGRVALHDLLASRDIAQVTVVDNPQVLKERLPKAGGPLPGAEKVRGVTLDASDRDGLAALMGQADVVIELLPGRLSLPTAQLAAEVGVSSVSTMYYTNPGEEDPAKVAARREELRVLNEKAKQKGITQLCEFGMDPGIDLALSLQAVRELDEVYEFYSYGAGFPEPSACNNPINYKFSWSIEGLFRSYYRPARILKDGVEVNIAAADQFAKTNMHYLDLPEIGRLESYPNGDAIKYIDELGIGKTVRSMARYTNRWPGHGAFWEIAAKCGFLTEVPVKVQAKTGAGGPGGAGGAGGAGEVTVTPLDFITALMGSQKQFHYADGERDVALIRIDARGKKGGRPARVIYQIIDYRDLATGFTAMSRTVGFPASIGAHMILDGTIKQRGLIYPTDVPFQPYMDELKKRGVKVEHVVE
ncbi:MAG: saccharopine dehydrogenase family protein [Bacillota bacterium]